MRGRRVTERNVRKQRKLRGWVNKRGGRQREEGRGGQKEGSV